MELVALARVLWQRRLAVGLGAVLAIAVALAIGSSPPERSALATTRVLLDTPQSQSVDNTPFGADTLPWRASLLAHLLNSEPNKRQLARALGIPLDQLFVSDAALSGPQVPSSLTKAASDVAALTSAPYELSIVLPNASLPLISIAAAAPDRTAARKLAATARDILRAAAPRPDPANEVKPGAKLSPAEAADTSKPYGYLVVDVAPIRVKTVADGKGPLKAVIVSLALFVAWCTGATLVPGFVRRVRRSPARKNRRSPAVEWAAESRMRS